MSNKLIEGSHVTLLQDNNKYDGTLNVYDDHYDFSGSVKQSVSYDISTFRVLKKPDLFYSAGRFGKAGKIGAQMMVAGSRCADFIVNTDWLEELIHAIDKAAKGKDTAEKEKKYAEAVLLYDNAVSSENVLMAAAIFKELGVFKDSVSYGVQCDLLYDQLREREYTAASALYSKINSEEEADKAIAAFVSLGDYKDAQAMVEKCRERKNEIIKELEAKEAERREKEELERQRKQAMEEAKKQRELEERKQAEAQKQRELEAQKQAEAEEAEHERVETQNAESIRDEIEKSEQKAAEESAHKDEKEENEKRVEDDNQYPDEDSKDQFDDGFTGMEHMNEKVQQFLKEQARQKKHQEQLYRDYVMRYANLLSDEEAMTEVTKYEYYSNQNLKHAMSAGKYFLSKKIPLTVSDEEFAAIEASIPKEELDEFRLKASGGRKTIFRDESSTASTFFMIVALIFWIGGLILSLAGANVTVQSGWREVQKFNFTVFITSFLTYFIYGCLAMCASELFDKLRKIINLLRSKD